MIKELDNDRYFRWFDSGDLYSLGLATKILEVAKATPWCNHWIPTRMHKFSKFHEVLSELEALPNVVIRRSSDSVTGGTVEGAYTSTIVPDDSMAPKGSEVCKAYTREGKCGDCRACWSKEVSIVAYVAHGRSMSKVLKDKGIIAKSS
jgi:hypothetical protein